MPKTVKQRQDDKRQEKLREVKRQIKDGSLVVRQMTRKEKAAAEQARKAEAARKGAPARKRR